METAAIPQYLIDRAIAETRDRNDAIQAIADAYVKAGRDAQLAPIWAEKLRHTFTGLIEKIYPELVAANGGVLPIDNSVDPASLEWEYFMIDRGAFVDWIDDDGDVMPSAFVKAERHTGKHAPFGGGYHYTIFDLERAAKVGLNLPREHGDAVKRAHDEFCEWTWMFGAPEKELWGLCTHPNINMSFAAVGASTSALPANKTNDEILADFLTLIDSVPQQTVEAHHVATVFVPPSLIREMRSRKIAGTSDGKVSLWDILLDMFKGDDSGQGKVSFKMLNVCDASRRINRKTGTDTSGLSGDLLIAIPPNDVSEACFIRCRALTWLPPQDENFKVKLLAHADIGGCKLVRPLSVHVMQYGTT